MAQASKKDRQIRKLKRERTLAFRMLDRVVIERNQARISAGTINNELKIAEAKLAALALTDAAAESAAPGTNKVAALLEKEPSE